MLTVQRRTSYYAPWMLMGLLFLGCSHTVHRHDWANYRGPGAEEFQKTEIDAREFIEFSDPLERMNRSIGVFNHGVILGVADPLAKGYRFLIPKPVRESLTRFGTNILYPRHLLANLLQGKLAGAGDETLRFVVNTTVGVLGFFDPATEWGIKPSREDFGQVFATWGWNPSAYLMLPLLGPSTLRDALGLWPDSLTDPLSYFFLPRLAFTFNELTDSVESYKQFTESTYDPYAISRIVWLLNRSVSIEDFEYVDEKAAAVESLGLMFLNVKDSDFPSTIDTREVSLPSTGRNLPYNFKLQDKPAPLDICLARLRRASLQRQCASASGDGLSPRIFSGYSQQRLQLGIHGTRINCCHAGSHSGGRARYTRRSRRRLSRPRRAIPWPHHQARLDGLLDGSVSCFFYCCRRAKRRQQAR